MRLMLQAFCYLSVDGFKDTQVMLQRGEFCGCGVGEVVVLNDKAAEITEESGVFLKVARAYLSSDPPTGANALKLTAHVFQLTHSVQKILAQSLLRCQFSHHALRISDFFFLVNKCL